MSFQYNACERSILVYLNMYQCIHSHDHLLMGVKLDGGNKGSRMIQNTTNEFTIIMEGIQNTFLLLVFGLCVPNYVFE